MSKLSQADFIAGREKRILKMIQAGATAAEMSERFGLEPDNMAKVRRDIIKRYGLRLTATARTSSTPFGMTSQSKTIRSNLSDHVNELLKRYDVQEVPELIGIPKKTLDKLKSQGYEYDWSLTQMQRLCAALYPDKPFVEFWNDLGKESSLKGIAARSFGAGV